MTKPSGKALAALPLDLLGTIERHCTENQRQVFLDRLYADYQELKKQNDEVFERKCEAAAAVYHSNKNEIDDILFGTSDEKEKNLGDWDTWERVETIVKHCVYSRPSDFSTHRKDLLAFQDRIETLNQSLLAQRQQIRNYNASLNDQQEELAALKNLLVLKERSIRTLRSERNFFQLQLRQAKRDMDLIRGTKATEEDELAKDFRMLLEANRLVEKENIALRSKLHAKFGTADLYAIQDDLQRQRETGKESSQEPKPKGEKRSKEDPYNRRFDTASQPFDMFSSGFLAGQFTESSWDSSTLSRDHPGSSLAERPPTKNTDTRTKDCFSEDQSIKSYKGFDVTKNSFGASFDERLTGPPDAERRGEGRGDESGDRGDKKNALKGEATIHEPGRPSGTEVMGNSPARTRGGEDESEERQRVQVKPSVDIEEWDAVLPHEPKEKESSLVMPITDAKGEKKGGSEGRKKRHDHRREKSRENKGEEKQGTSHLIRTFQSNSRRAKILEKGVPLSSIILRLKKRSAALQRRMEAEAGNMMSLLDYDARNETVDGLFKLVKSAFTSPQPTVEEAGFSRFEGFNGAEGEVEIAEPTQNVGVAHMSSRSSCISLPERFAKAVNSVSSSHHLVNSLMVNNSLRQLSTALSHPLPSIPLYGLSSQRLLEPVLSGRGGLMSRERTSWVQDERISDAVSATPPPSKGWTALKKGILGIAELSRAQCLKREALHVLQLREKLARQQKLIDFLTADGKNPLPSYLAEPPMDTLLRAAAEKELVEPEHKERSRSVEERNEPMVPRESKRKASRMTESSVRHASFDELEGSDVFSMLLQRSLSLPAMEQPSSTDSLLELKTKSLTAPLLPHASDSSFVPISESEETKREEAHLNVARVGTPVEEGKKTHHQEEPLHQKQENDGRLTSAEGKLPSRVEVHEQVSDRLAQQGKHQEKKGEEMHKSEPSKEQKNHPRKRNVLFQQHSAEEEAAILRKFNIQTSERSENEYGKPSQWGFGEAVKGEKIFVGGEKHHVGLRQRSNESRGLYPSGSDAMVSSNMQLTGMAMETLVGLRHQLRELREINQIVCHQQKQQRDEIEEFLRLMGNIFSSLDSMMEETVRTKLQLLVEERGSAFEEKAANLRAEVLQNKMTEEVMNKLVEARVQDILAHDYGIMLGDKSRFQREGSSQNSNAGGQSSKHPQEMTDEEWVAEKLKKEAIRKAKKRLSDDVDALMSSEAFHYFVGEDENYPRVDEEASSKDRFNEQLPSHLNQEEVTGVCEGSEESDEMPDWLRFFGIRQEGKNTVTDKQSTKKIGKSSQQLLRYLLNEPRLQSEPQGVENHSYRGQRGAHFSSHTEKEEENGKGEEEKDSIVHAVVQGRRIGNSNHPFSSLFPALLYDQETAVGGDWRYIPIGSHQVPEVVDSPRAQKVYRCFDFKTARSAEILQFLRDLQPSCPKSVENLSPTVQRCRIHSRIDANVLKSQHRLQNSIHDLFSDEFTKFVHRSVMPLVSTAEKIYSPAHRMDGPLLASIQELRKAEEIIRRRRMKFLFRRVVTNIRQRLIMRQAVFRGSAFMSFLGLLYSRWQKHILKEEEMCVLGISNLNELLFQVLKGEIAKNAQVSQARRTLIRTDMGDLRGHFQVGQSSFHFSSVELPYDERLLKRKKNRKPPQLPPL